MKGILVIITFLAATLAPTAVARESAHAGHELPARSQTHAGHSAAQPAHSLVQASNSAKAFPFSIVIVALAAMDCDGGHCPACFEQGTSTEMCSNCFMEQESPPSGTVPSGISLKVSLSAQLKREIDKGRVSPLLFHKIVPLGSSIPTRLLPILRL